jgi:hypothetical protein
MYSQPYSSTVVDGPVDKSSDCSTVVQGSNPGGVGLHLVRESGFSYNSMTKGYTLWGLERYSVNASTFR